MKKLIFTMSLIIIILNLLTSLSVLPQVTQDWVSRYNGPGNSNDYANASVADDSGNFYVTGYCEDREWNKDYITIKYNSSGIQQWLARYNGPGDDWDIANKIAIDESGNVYVTGMSINNGNGDFATIKYSPAGIQQWVSRYTSTGGPSDENATAIAVDGSGNVYVTGHSAGDYSTIKYNSSGDSVWVRRYGEPGFSTDYASSISVDNSGNVYVTGESSVFGTGTGSDYATIKYNSAGTEQWVARYNGPANNEDGANSIASDNLGNVYVTGYSSGDYATIKYNSSGDSVWVKRFSGPGNSLDEAYSLAIDHSGNVLVTGVSDGGFGSTSLDYLTIKYSTAGTALWTVRYNGTGNSFDYAYSIAADGSDNVYVTGRSFGSGTFDDYATVKYNSNGVQQWVSRYNGTGNTYDAAGSIAVDNSGNAYVTGESGDNGTYSDVVSIKYNSSGNSVWVTIYDGPGNNSDNAVSMAADDLGNVYVTGYSRNGTSSDFVTVKYNSAGDSVWKAVYGGSEYNNDKPYSIAADNSGNVYVTGGNSVSNGSSDYITIKYNSSGVQQWAARYNGQGNSEDIARSISVDSSGNVFVTGGSGSSSFLDYVTVKYNTSGIQQWAARYNGPGDGYDAAASISSDGSGNVYVTGGSDGGFGVSTDYATIKYNSDGIQQWVARYNGTGNGTDFASSIFIDGSENIYVTGGSDGGTGSLYDYATIKYNSSGEQQWAARYNGPENLIDIASSIFVDDNGNVYVTGSDSGGVNSSFTTIKYNSSGESEWNKTYNNASGNSIAVDNSGNVFVTGVSRVKETDYDFLTIKYNSDGIQQWDEIYNGPGNSTDIANSIALDKSGNVYISGGSTGIGTNFDFATIKYSQSVGITQVATTVPVDFTLAQNYPNPFNPVTNLEFGISDLGFVSLKVYDILGKEVATLVNEKLSPGNYRVEFNGSGLPSGVYFYRLTAGEFTDTKRMMIVK